MWLISSNPTSAGTLPTSLKVVLPWLAYRSPKDGGPSAFQDGPSGATWELENCPQTGCRFVWDLPQWPTAPQCSGRAEICDPMNYIVRGILQARILDINCVLYGKWPDLCVSQCLHMPQTVVTRINKPQIVSGTLSCAQCVWPATKTIL